MDTDNTSTTIISSEKVRGVNVYSPEAEKLGSVDELMIDKITGRVRYAVMEFGGFLGMRADRYPLPWEALKYHTGMGGYVVALTKEQLENAPRYESNAAPEYTDEYGRRVYDYYGMPYM